MSDEDGGDDAVGAGRSSDSGARVDRPGDAAVNGEERFVTGRDDRAAGEGTATPERADGVNGADGDDESGGNVAGQVFGLDDDLEPGSPSLENTVFVLLGALAAAFFLLKLAGII